MRLGAEGEKYAGIRKDEVNVGGRITVADDRGPFGNPTSDSARTMVTPATTELLVVVYAPTEIRESRSSSAWSARPPSDSPQITGRQRDHGSLRSSGTCFSVSASRGRLAVLQPPVEEVRRRLVAAHPVLVPQEVVHFVREHQLLDLDVPLAQRR